MSENGKPLEKVKPYMPCANAAALLDLQLTKKRAGTGLRARIFAIVGSAVYGEPENLSRASEATDAILAAGLGDSAPADLAGIYAAIDEGVRISHQMSRHNEDANEVADILCGIRDELLEPGDDPERFAMYRKVPTDV